MGALSCFDCCIKYLMSMIHVFNKYAWAKPLIDRKAKIILNGFIELVNNVKRKPRKS